MMNPDASEKDSAAPVTNESTAEPDWAAIRQAYDNERDIKVADICRRFGIKPGRLRYRIDREGWPTRRVPRQRPERIKVVRPSRKQLIGRMLNLLERHVLKLEADNVTPTDKEATLLGSASRTLGKLVELDENRSRSGKGNNDAPSSEMAELRKKIAERIDQLNQG